MYLFSFRLIMVFLLERSGMIPVSLSAVSIHYLRYDRQTPRPLADISHVSDTVLRLVGCFLWLKPACLQQRSSVYRKQTNRNARHMPGACVWFWLYATWDFRKAKMKSSRSPSSTLCAWLVSCPVRTSFTMV